MRHNAVMRFLLIGALALGLAAPAFAAGETPGLQSRPQSQPQSEPQQKPAGDMDRLLPELRDLDSSQDEDGDHVVGELLC